MRRALVALAILVAAGVGGFFVLTQPDRVDAKEIASLSGGAAAGERVFHIGGCSSCHAAPDAEDDAKLVLAGGEAFPTGFGTFYAPNISPGAQGIGDWSLEAFATAMRHGVSPDGRHYYPAFPYASYERMKLEDIADLFAYMKTLPESDAESRAHDVGFPFSIRRGLGLWKLLYLDPSPVLESEDPEVLKGRYLVEGPGHCAECHTPRTLLGGLDRSRWMAGAPLPGGDGGAPNLTPHESGLGWSAADIAGYLKTGFTPDYDVVGGEMASVVDNLGQLPDEDIDAIVAYLKALPPLPPLPSDDAEPGG